MQSCVFFNIMASKDVREKLNKLLLRGATKEEMTSDLKWMQSMKSWIDFHCPTLQTFFVKGETIAWIVVHPCTAIVKQIGSVDVRILINLDKSFQLQVLHNTVKQCEPGMLSHREMLLPLLHSFEPDSDYIICKGLDKSNVEKLGRVPKGVRLWEGQDRMDSLCCSMWITKDNANSHKRTNSNMCQECTLQSHYVVKLLKKSAELSTPDKSARAQCSSACNYRFLTPKSLKRRYRRHSSEKRYLRKLRKTIKSRDIDVDDDQNNQITEICNVIEEQFPDNFLVSPP